MNIEDIFSKLSESKTCWHYVKLVIDKKLKSQRYLQCSSFFVALSSNAYKNVCKRYNIVTSVPDSALEPLFQVLEMFENYTDINKENYEEYSIAELFVGMFWRALKINNQTEAFNQKVFSHYLAYEQEIKYNTFMKDGKICLIYADDINIITIDSVKKYWETLLSFKRNSQQLYFRGHRNINYYLEPSIYRDGFYNNEYKIFCEAKVRCETVFRDCKNYLQMLALMQHNGVPTRLLDISTNPLVALYFAVEKYEDDVINNRDGEVIVIDDSIDSIKYDSSDSVEILATLPTIRDKIRNELVNIISLPKNKRRKSAKKFEKLCEHLTYEIRCERPPFENHIRYKNLKKCILVKPIKNSVRIMRQAGVFIICGLSKYGTFSNTKKIMKKRYSVKVKVDSTIKETTYVLYVPCEYKEKIFNELDILKINHANIYPEIEHAAEYIKNKYNDPLRLLKQMDVLSEKC